MRNYWIAFVLIVSIGFTGLSILVFKCFQKPKPVLVYLDFEKMQEAGKSIVDTNYYDLVSVFSSNKQNSIADTIPWANLYVCKSYNKQDSLSGDTALLFVDVLPKETPKVKYEELGYVAKYRSGPKYKKCKVMIPADQLIDIKRYRYKFGNVDVMAGIED